LDSLLRQTLPKKFLDSPEKSLPRNAQNRAGVGRRFHLRRARGELRDMRCARRPLLQGSPGRPS